jgi:hypothetical protein
MKLRRWQYLAVATALAAFVFRGAPPAQSVAVAAVGQTPTADQIPYEATAGGSASITGFQVPGLTLTAQGNGIGKSSIGGPTPSTVNITVQIRADVDVTQNPVQIKNGTMLLVAPNGDEVHGTFEGTGSAPDAAGFMDVMATFQSTSGKGRYSGGGGTVVGVVNFLRSSFSITVRGNVTRAGQA